MFALPTPQELDELVTYWNGRTVAHEDEPFDSLLLDMGELYPDEDAAELYRRANAIYGAIKSRLTLEVE